MVGEELITATPNNHPSEIGESIKLTKNTKGYNWELTIRTKGNEIIDVPFIDRLTKLNTEMITRFSTE